MNISNKNICIWDTKSSNKFKELNIKIKKQEKYKEKNASRESREEEESEEDLWPRENDRRSQVLP